MSYLPLPEDNRLDVEHVAEDLAHAAFGHGNTEEFLRGYFARQLAALVDRRQRAALDEREGHPMYVGELQSDGTYSVRREDVRLMTRALLLVDAHLEREFADDPAQRDAGTELATFADAVDEALDAAGLDSQAKRDAAREAMRGEP